MRPALRLSERQRRLSRLQGTEVWIVELLMLSGHDDLAKGAAGRRPPDSRERIWPILDGDIDNPLVPRGATTSKGNRPGQRRQRTDVTICEIAEIIADTSATRAGQSGTPPSPTGRHRGRSTCPPGNDRLDGEDRRPPGTRQHHRAASAARQEPVEPISRKPCATS